MIMAGKATIITVNPGCGKFLGVRRRRHRAGAAKNQGKRSVALAEFIPDLRRPLVVFFVDGVLQELVKLLD